MKYDEQRYRYQIGYPIFRRWIFWRNVSRTRLMDGVRKFFGQGNDTEILAMISPPVKPTSGGLKVYNDGRRLYRVILRKG